MALPYPTLALIFLAIVATALGRATFAEANGEVSKKHEANANATAPVNPAPTSHPVEATRNQAADGDHVGAPAGSVVKGHHTPGKGHHKKGGHRKKGGHLKKGGHHKRHPAGAPASPVTEAQPATVPASPPIVPTVPASPPTVPQPARAPAATPSIATPPTGGRVRIPPEVKKLLPSLPPSAEPQEIKELISKATGVDPSKIPEISDGKKIEEIIAKAIEANALPPNSDPKQIEDIVTQVTGMKPSDALAAFQASGGLGNMLTVGVPPGSDAGAAGTNSSTKEASGAFTIGATSTATALVAAVAAGCFIF